MGKNTQLLKRTMYRFQGASSKGWINLKKNINGFEWEGNAAITLAAQVIAELDNINELDRFI
ncbi:hypothetical protein [Bacillus cereus]|uniref:hypothetical protein n=1 Tax=Bacillus cereus TaxID=1396 RepID=UPI000BFE0C54|nr:hypothetical protein [Bacillus cereus]PGY72404.1 hypothetical protein COE42_17335 [Bacillus cereus]